MFCLDGRSGSGVLSALGLLFACGSSACSADAVNAPEPTVDTPGAFVASFDVAEEEIRLFRSVSRLRFGEDDYLLLTILYAQRPASFAAARQLAREPGLPEQVHQYLTPRSRVLSQPHEVVWFRSLSSDEISPDE